MAFDVQPITDPAARAAARLCNFRTGEAVLLPAHAKWLDANVAPLLRALPDPFVDIVGYASRLGDSGFNAKLSEARCEAARRRVESYGVPVGSMAISLGESVSTGPAQDNSGFWRAVEVFVYGAPQPPKPAPKPAYDRVVRLHFRSVALPVVPEFTALANARKIYDRHNILLEMASGLSMGATPTELLELDASDGTCKWSQASDEQKLLDRLGGRRNVGEKDVVVYYVNQIAEKKGGTLNGCAGHAPGRAAVVVAASGSPWTLGHELAHVLLGPGFSPVHSEDAANLMFAPTAGITADPPSLDAKQAAAIRSSPFCQPLTG